MASITLRIDKGSPLTNSELDDNFRQLNLNKIELGGDLGGGTSAPVVISLRGNAVSSAIPTTGQTLTWSGSAWIPATPAGGASVSSTITSTVTNTFANTVSSTLATLPAFSAYPSSSVTQTILGNGTQQKVLFQNEEFDTNNNFANSAFTPTVAGYYQLNAVVRLSGTSGTGENMIILYKNGAEYHRGWNNSGTEIGVNFFSMQVSALAYANGTTDYFEIYVQQGSGSSRDITIAHSASGIGNITWFNGVMVPTQLITSVAATAAVTSIVVTDAIAGGGGIVTVLNDISDQFNNSQRIFTLKDGPTAIVDGVHYRDNKDFTVMIGNRSYRPAVPQTTTLGPWLVDYKAERTYTFRITGSRIIFERAIENRQTADIRINTISATRQKRSRYPFSANSIVLGD